jgi:RimJ/RimL family protein N-acetyltransferase
MPLSICTARLRLTELSIEDIPALRELDADPVVREFIDGGRPIDWDSYDQRTKEWLESLNALGPYLGFWGARLIASSEFAGWFHLRPNPGFGQRVELGYRLKQSAWGKGLATEGSMAILAYGFNQLGLDSIMAQTLRRNLSSRRVLEKIGMRIETDFVYPYDRLPFWSDTERSAVRYVIERETWSEREVHETHF